MSDTDTGVEFTPDETAYFESGGSSPVETEAKPEAEVTPEVATEEKIEDKVEKVVPLAAVHEERAKRKELQAKLRQIELENAEYKGRFKIIERLQEPEAPAPKPKVEEDPFAALGHHDKTIDALQKRLDDYENATKAQTERGNLERNYQAAASQYLQEKPDFMAAYTHLIKSRAEELEDLGYEGAQLAEALRNEELSIASNALRAGKNPAETIYKLATRRGYVFKDAKQDTAAKLDNIERGQAANKSLANTGGNTGETEMTGDRLVKMPIDEFEAWVNKNPAKARRLMGG